MRKGDINKVKTLIEAGADVNVNAKNNNGETGLMIAEKKGHKEIVELLKAGGAK